MTKANPTVSVCIPTYNRAGMLKEAISSVLGQSFPDCELIISDNGSDDNTEEIINSFCDERIVYIRNRANIGLINNFNQCLEVAKGQYVTIFHDDDMMLPDNLLCKMKALGDNPSVGFVHSKFDVMDECGKILEYARNLGSPQDHDYVEKGHSFVARTVAGRNVVNPPSVLMRRECYKKVGGFSDKLLYAADYEYWMRIALYYDVMFLARPLVRYRKHPGWGTAQFMAVVDGSLVSTIDGLREQYEAKRRILRQARYMVKDWKELRGKVRREMSGRIVRLIEDHMLGRGQKRGAGQALSRMCREFPEIIRERPVVKLLLKCWLSDAAINVLKRWGPVGSGRGAG